MITKSSNPLSFIKKYEEFSINLSKETPDWFNNLRQQGLSRFIECGLPKIKDEEWKYTNISPITQHTYQIATDGQLMESDLFWKYCSKDEINIVFINGAFSKDYSNLKNIPKGFKIMALKEALVNYEATTKKLLSRYETNEETTFEALNKALMNDGAFIEIDDNISSDALIHIVYVTSVGDNETVCAPRSLISIGTSSEATILESHLSLNDDMVYFCNALTDIHVGENATLHYCKSQKESLKGYHIGITRVWQERNSNFDSFSLMVGSTITRNNVSVILNGEGANTTINGLYSTNGKQHVDNHTVIDHRVPHCTSNQLYKGILNGASRGVFNGKIFVRPIAQGTNSYQLNKNLLMGKDARIDTKPQLEIFADDVKCTHGATISQLNEDEIFYIQSRSIPKKEAIRMLSRGFVDDVLNMIRNDSINQKFHLILEPTFAAL